MANTAKPEIITPLDQLREDVTFLIEAARAIDVHAGSTNIGVLQLCADAAETSLWRLSGPTPDPEEGREIKCLTNMKLKRK